MGSRILVAVLLVVTALYCWGLGWIAWGFFRSDEPVGWGLGLGVLILLLLTVWVTWREALFGLASARASRAYAEELHDGSIPAPLDAPRAEFNAARAAIENSENPTWQDWFRLALAYEALRDRRHARAAVRQALQLRRS